VALLGGDSAILLMADQAAERSIAYILPNQDQLGGTPLSTPRMDRNTIVQGVVRGSLPGRGPPAVQQPKYLSVIIGDKKELKWNVYEIFSRPGLRRDVMLLQVCEYWLRKIKVNFGIMKNR